MLKAITENDGKPLTVFGLSDENIKRLKEDHPISIDFSDLGKPEWGTLLIFNGKDEKSMREIFVQNFNIKSEVISLDTMRGKRE